MHGDPPGALPYSARAAPAGPRRRFSASRHELRLLGLRALVRAGLRHPPPRRAAQDRARAERRRHDGQHGLRDVARARVPADHADQHRGRLRGRDLHRARAGRLGAAPLVAGGLDRDQPRAARLLQVHELRAGFGRAGPELGRRERGHAGDVAGAAHGHQLLHLLLDELHDRRVPPAHPAGRALPRLLLLRHVLPAPRGGADHPRGAVLLPDAAPAPAAPARVQRGRVPDRVGAVLEDGLRRQPVGRRRRVVDAGRGRQARRPGSRAASPT